MKTENLNIDKSPSDITDNAAVIKTNVLVDCECQAPDMTPLSFLDGYTTKIILVRHGESQGNAKRMFLGHTDLDLSDHGFLQAERTAAFLADENIDVIYSSDLKRALSTALPHEKYHNITVIPDVGLREMFVGGWEGMLFEDIKNDFGTYFSEEWVKFFHSFRGAPDGGESTPALAERIYSTLLDIAGKNVGKTILAVFHAAAIRAFWGKLAEMDGDDPYLLKFPTNASVSVIYYDEKNGKFLRGEYSHDQHMTDLMPPKKPL